MSNESISVSEAARFLGIEEAEARKLADSGDRVPLDTVQSQAGAAALALELAREELGRLSGELKESTEERLMLMERIEHIARVEEGSPEIERLRSRRLLDR